MTKYNRPGRLGILFCSLLSLIIFTAVCTSFRPMRSGEGHDQLADTLSRVLRHVPGQVGVAVIINGTDTVAVNNENIYPMMSVFKLHQAIALCSAPELRGLSLDSVMEIRRDQLDTTTWSPMLKFYTTPTFKISIRQLLRYSLTQSDNNASNLMFERLLSATRTDDLIAGIIPRESFRIVYTESQMKEDHDKAYSNRTSPLGAAMLIDRLFSDSLLMPARQEFIKRTLGECATGNDRLAAPLLNQPGVTIAHKTGSGYRTSDGLLMAHNDVGYITLPNGIHYSMAVFVKDFDGSEEEAAKVIAQLSAIVYSALSGSLTK